MIRLSCIRKATLHLQPIYLRLLMLTLKNASKMNRRPNLWRWTRSICIGLMALLIAGTAPAIAAELPEDAPEELRAQLASESTAFDLAAPYYAHSIIDPRETRDYLIRVLEDIDQRKTNGIGEHLMSNWPSTF